MQINLSELLTVNGKSKQYEATLDMDKFRCNAGQFSVVHKQPVQINITHTGNRKLIIDCECKLSVEFPCDRCLKPVIHQFELSFDRDVDLEVTEEERLEALDEQSYINGYNLDVDQLVYGELIVNMPMKVLCSDSCKGICNRCGINLNFESCHCDDTELDPRMSVIRDIFNNFKEV